MSAKKETGPSNDYFGSSISSESIKATAKTIDIDNLPDDAAEELAGDVTYKLKQIILDATKFMRHGIRDKLLPCDIDAAIKVKGMEPQYGFQSKEHVPFAFASGGGRQLDFIEEKEVNLKHMLQNLNLTIPREVELKTHWLCIDGVQPVTPDNPPPVSVEEQKLQAVDPHTWRKREKGKQRLRNVGTMQNVDPVQNVEAVQNVKTLQKVETAQNVEAVKNVETVQTKQLTKQKFSAKEHLYFKEITEACIGADETKRTEALLSLSSDTCVLEMLPRMCTFIIEGVRVNVGQKNFALLIYLMRMIKALLGNPWLCLEDYLHYLIPSVTTCIVSNDLCMHPEVDNHWVLRDFASRLMAQICKTFNTETNNLQNKVTHMFANTLNDEKIALPLLYGVLAGLSGLGDKVVRNYILPKTYKIGFRIQKYLTDAPTSYLDKIAAEHIKELLVKVVAPVLKSTRTPPDLLDVYIYYYGCLGPDLHTAVTKARTQLTPSSVGGESVLTPNVNPVLQRSQEPPTGY